MGDRVCSLKQAKEGSILMFSFYCLNFICFIYKGGLSLSIWEDTDPGHGCKKTENQQRYTVTREKMWNCFIYGPKSGFMLHRGSRKGCTYACLSHWAISSCCLYEGNLLSLMLSPWNFMDFSFSVTLLNYPGRLDWALCSFQLKGA